jgi:UDP-glucose 4-epimerase
MKILVTGGAGFVGSNLTKRLLADGHEVVVYDNFYLGKREFIQPFESNVRFSCIHEDLLDFPRVAEAVTGCDLVFHLAANSDISLGRKQTDLDLRLGTLTTWNVLEAMRLKNVQKIIFASTSAVYGEALVVPTPEDYGPLLPISLYGASKLASEGFITAFAHNYGLKAWIFRFGNVAGPNCTHGIFFDFIHRLQNDPTKLLILGDGLQAKPYIHVSDLIDGMLFGFSKASGDVNVFNLATEGNTKVDSIAKIVVSAMKLTTVTFEHTGEKRGWLGDVPRVALDISRMRSLGWAASLSSDEAVMRAADEIVEQFGKKIDL